MDEGFAPRSDWIERRTKKGKWILDSLPVEQTPEEALANLRRTNPRIKFRMARRDRDVDRRFKDPGI